MNNLESTQLTDPTFMIYVLIYGIVIMISTYCTARVLISHWFEEIIVSRIENIVKRIKRNN